MRLKWFNYALQEKGANFEGITTNVRLRHGRDGERFGRPVTGTPKGKGVGCERKEVVQKEGKEKGRDA